MPINPYEVLGVGPGATEDQIKDAYRRLARKYQADEYRASPLSDIAQQKMRELDQAYDTLMQNRRPNATGGERPYTGAQNPHGYAGTATSYPDVRAKLSANRIDDAEMLLDGIPPASRDAEWCYLKGVIAQQRGWFDEAERYFALACEQDPRNIEYASAYNQVHNDRAGGFRTARGRGTRSGDCSACDICSSLLCADCCCECMGGDCIPCC